MQRVHHHGKGDYLVCGVKDGLPDFKEIMVVNGELFAKTFLCRIKQRTERSYIMYWVSCRKRRNVWCN